MTLWSQFMSACAESMSQIFFSRGTRIVYFFWTTLSFHLFHRNSNDKGQGFLKFEGSICAECRGN